MKSKYIISIISILAIDAAHAAISAADRTNLASKAYVDVTRQDKITVQNNGVGNAVTIASKTADYRGQTNFGATGVYDGTSNYSVGDANKLVKTGAVADMIQTLESVTIPDDKLVCANSPECSLWTKPTAGARRKIASAGTFAPFTQCMVNGATGCISDNDCCNYCDDTFKPYKCASCKSSSATCSTNAECCTQNCVNNTCACILPGGQCTKTSQCCSGAECIRETCSFNI